MLLTIRTGNQPIFPTGSVELSGTWSVSADGIVAYVRTREEAIALCEMARAVLLQFGPQGASYPVAEVGDSNVFNARPVTVAEATVPLMKLGQIEDIEKARAASAKIEEVKAALLSNLIDEADAIKLVMDTGISDKAAAVIVGDWK